jgi:hypothetical protein
VLCEYCGVVVSGGRDTCQNCGARVYRQPTFSDSKNTEAYVYSTLFQEEKQMKLYVLVGTIFLVIGLMLVLFLFILIFSPIISWILAIGAFILIGAGVIIVASNLRHYK